MHSTEHCSGTAAFYIVNRNRFEEVKKFGVLI